MGELPPPPAAPIAVASNRAALRRLTIVLIAALAAWALLCVLVFSEEVWRPYSDSAVYILAARSLAAGAGYTYLGEPILLHPPGLSVLLQPFVAGTIDWSVLNRLVQLCAAGSFALIALALARLHGAALGVLAALLFALSPLAVGAQNVVLTEYPFLLLFFGGAWLLTPRPEQGPVGLGRGLLGAALIAASLYLRTVALIALPAMLLADLFRRGPRRWQGALLAAFALALCLPWLLHARREVARAPPATQFKTFDYATGMFHVDIKDPGSPLVGLDVWGERVLANTSHFVSAVGRTFLGGVQGAPAVMMTLLLAAALVFTWLDRRSMLDWYAMGCVAVLLTMFVAEDRYLLPLLPLLISALLHAANRLGRLLGPGSAERVAPVAAVSLLMVVVGLAGLSEARANPANREANRITDETVADWLRANTAQGASVLGDRAAVLSVLSGRTVYSYRHLPGGAAAQWPEVDWAVLGPGRVPLEARLQRAALAETSITVQLPDKLRRLRVYKLREADPGD